MYCSEKIENVYIERPNVILDDYYYLDCSYDMALYISDRFRIILETQSNYVFIQADGIFRHDKNSPVDSLARPDEEIENCKCTEEELLDDTYFEDYEYTLFVGERISRVEQNDSFILMEFDDFSLNIVPHKSKDGVPPYGYVPYKRVRGTERLITRKCSCGGTGELWLESISDYLVRCSKCHLSSYANILAREAIAEWNAGEELSLYYDLPEEEFFRDSDDEIEYIALPEDTFMADENPVECNSLIIARKKQKFKLTCIYAGYDKYEFDFEQVSSCNKKMWPHRIEPEKQGKITFIRKEDEEGFFPVLRFSLGDSPLLITANDAGLAVGLSHWDVNGEWLEYESSHLFDEEYIKRNHSQKTQRR